MKTPNLELVSFALCPYVQRSVITLKKKKVDFKLTLIELDNPPAWFEKMSPLGKVPLLLVRDQEGAEPTVLFESAVINEYVDEITPPAFLPSDPLLKARERAWVEVGSEMLGSLFEVQMSSSAADAEEPMKEFFDLTKVVEGALPGGPTFRKGGFSLLDSTFAPIFVRAFMFPQIGERKEWDAVPKVREWAKNLIALPEVRESMVPDFREKYAILLKKRGSFLAA